MNGSSISQAFRLLSIRHWRKKTSESIRQMSLLPFAKKCSGQLKLATALAFFRNNRADSFDINPPVRAGCDRLRSGRLQGETQG